MFLLSYNAYSANHSPILLFWYLVTGSVLLPMSCLFFMSSNVLVLPPLYLFHWRCAELPHINKGHTVFHYAATCSPALGYMYSLKMIPEYLALWILFDVHVNLAIFSQTKFQGNRNKKFSIIFGHSMHRVIWLFQTISNDSWLSFVVLYLVWCVQHLINIYFHKKHMCIWRFLLPLFICDGTVEGYIQNMKYKWKITSS